MNVFGFGLRARLAFTISILLVAQAAFFVLYFPRQNHKTAEKGLERQGYSLAHVIATTAAPLMNETDSGAADLMRQNIVRAGAADPDIDYIAVIKPGGQIFASYESDVIKPEEKRTSPQQVERMVTTDDHIHWSIPLKPGNQALGSIAIGVSKRKINGNRSETVWSAMYLGGAIVLFGFFVSLFLAARVTRPLGSAARGLATVSDVLVASAREQESTSAQEAAAVAETRRSMETLLDSAQQIATRSSEVLGNAERNAVSNKRIAERIDNLNALSDKVAEILATIMQVADKADLLALNASLEGTKAGEAGKGFTLVAAEMRRLAENVMESVASIRHLMKDMQGASRGAAGASEEGTRSSDATAESARQIARLTQDQRAATEQVILSMDEMSNVLSHTIEAVQRTAGAAQDVEDLAATLGHLVSPTAPASDETDYS